MTDKEMLMFLYGVIKTLKACPSDVVRRLERHLWPDDKKAREEAADDYAEERP